MSHFTVLVVGPETREELDAALMPFHEYECTGIQAYTEWVDEHDKVEKKWNEKCADMYRRGALTVPAHDPYLFRKPTDAEKEIIGPLAGSGSGGGISWSSRHWPGCRGEYETRVFDPEGGGFQRVEGIRRCNTGEYADMDEFAKNYFGYTGKRDGRYGRVTNPNAKWDWWTIGGRWANSIPLKQEPPRGHFREQQPRRKVDQARVKDVDMDNLPVTFAILHNGEWIERGTMGWWAVVADENQNWDADWRVIVDALDDNAMLTMVDAHI